MKYIDLRSDTVTKPTRAMRQAMAEAEVGDDVYGEDPTVNRLEDTAAALLGKEAGLFVPSGTMGNTIAIKAHTEHGQEVICEARAHILNYELAMMGWFAGCLARPIEAIDGILTWQSVRAQIRGASPHWAPTGLVEIENTNNLAGGTVYPMAVLQEIYEGARASGLPVHMDGARIFNAATHLRVPVREVAAYADTVMFCLSKALGAPVGSVLVGPRELINKGRLYRKRLGGGMRQAGVLAAAGLIALEQSPARLPEDHANARMLATELAKVPGVSIDPARVQTNILIFGIADTGVESAELSAALRQRGVLANGAGPTHMRMVTHFDVTAEECRTAAAAVRNALCGALTYTA